MRASSAMIEVETLAQIDGEQGHFWCVQWGLLSSLMDVSPYPQVGTFVLFSFCGQVEDLSLPAQKDIVSSCAEIFQNDKLFVEKQIVHCIT